MAVVAREAAGGGRDSSSLRRTIAHDDIPQQGAIASEQPNVLIAYESTSGHTKSLAQAIANGFDRVGMPESRLRVLPLRLCNAETVHWADVILFGGPSLKGETSAAVGLFTELLAQLAEKHEAMKGRIAASFSTGGAFSAGVEIIIDAANKRLKGAGFKVPNFDDNWHFSVGLIAITGHPPFCQVGQTDRFPHEVGDKAIMSGCEVGREQPVGSIHPHFHTLAAEYARRVHLLAVDQLSQRRINLSEERDRQFASTPPESVTQLTELKPKVASHAASQSMGGEVSASLPQSFHITPIALVHSVRSHAGAAVGIALLATAVGLFSISMNWSPRTSASHSIASLPRVPSQGDVL